MDLLFLIFGFPVLVVLTDPSVSGNICRLFEQIAVKIRTSNRHLVVALTPILPEMLDITVALMHSFYAVLLYLYMTSFDYFISRPAAKHRQVELERNLRELHKLYDQSQKEIEGLRDDQKRISLQKEELDFEFRSRDNEWRQRVMELENNLRRDMNNMIQSCDRLLSASNHSHGINVREHQREFKKQAESHQRTLKELGERMDNLRREREQYKELCNAAVPEELGLREKLTAAWEQIDIHQRDARVRKIELHVESSRADQAMERCKNLEASLKRLEGKLHEVMSIKQQTEASLKVQTSKADRWRDQGLRMRQELADLHEQLDIRVLQKSNINLRKNTYGSMTAGVC
ncbi:hypothetical protein TruAng_005699 [Truncatella angustata]|nr:hypothetical protein TruAng_005699 [Truncatella angustata]